MPEYDESQIHLIQAMPEYDESQIHLVRSYLAELIYGYYK